MTKKKRFGVSQAITRGLSETIHVVENNAAVFRNVVLPLSRIELDPDNPRKLAITLEDIRHGFSKDDPAYQRKQEEYERLMELAYTIQNSGIINPVVVYKRGELYRVVAGERRCLASILAGKNEIDARVFNEKPKGFELKLLQWVENTAREDLSLDERIGNIREIIREYQHQKQVEDMTATLLKTLTGLSLSQATYYLAVLNAPHDVKLAIEHGHLQSLDKAAVLAGIDAPELRHEALQACLNGCSLKDLRKLISDKKETFRKKAVIEKNNKRGRAATRVNMGSTLTPSVVQVIVHSVLNQPEFKKYSDLFAKIDWDQFDQATHAFRKLVELLEHEIAR